MTDSDANIHPGSHFACTHAAQLVGDVLDALRMAARPSGYGACKPFQGDIPAECDQIGRAELAVGVGSFDGEGVYAWLRSGAGVPQSERRNYWG